MGSTRAESKGRPRGRRAKSKPAAGDAAEAEPEPDEPEACTPPDSDPAAAVVLSADGGRGGAADEASLKLPPGELVPYARNAKEHPEEQLAQVMASIREFGFTAPILLDEDRLILAGHGRQIAATRLGLELVPCRQIFGLTEAQKRAYVIADNKLTENGGWNQELLQLELADLQLEEFDLNLLGFDEKELESALNFGLDDPELKDEPAPEPPTDPIVKPGELWLLGRHRLVCGDSTDPAAVALCLSGAVPFLMVTDPPYGGDYDPNWRLAAGIDKPGQVRSDQAIENDHRGSWREAFNLFPGCVCYVWHGVVGGHAATIANDLLASGFEIRSQIIWRKESLVIGRGAYHWQHEPCWYGARGPAKWAGGRKESTVWEFPSLHRQRGDVDDSKTAHSTQKPLEAMARPIRNHGSPDDAVYDPFLGSGTTLLAAEQLGRVCFGLEISPAFCDVIISRWESFTGQKAKRGEV